MTGVVNNFYCLLNSPAHQLMTTVLFIKHPGINYDHSEFGYRASYPGYDPM